MGIKQALIVDDSKTARLVLKRMLKDLALDVDTVESAADALDYLERHRPDVIFMDHNMPGMDGFEAVRRIKNNAQTVVIPIMMYTSRGGDVYLSQARALGAVGIIPKTVSPVGLKESLFKLGLVDDRRIESSLVLDERRTESPLIVDERRVESTQVDDERRVESALVVDGHPVNESDEDAINASYSKERNDRDAFLDELRMLMDDQTIELHNSMWLGVEAVSHEIFNRLNGEREKQLEKDKAALPVKNPLAVPFYIVTVMLVLSLAFNVIIFYGNNQLASDLADTVRKQVFISTEGVTQETVPVDSSRTVVPDHVVVDEVVPDKQNALEEFIAWAQNKVIEYPFDELALNDNRLPEIEALVNRAQESGFTGSIILQTHVGIFCTSKNQDGSYSLADENLPITKCDNIGNGMQPGDAPSTHQSLGFANYLSEVNFQNEKGLQVEVANISRITELSEYPEVIPENSVAEWNHAAQLNNRITVKLEPASAEPEQHGSAGAAVY